MNTQQAIRDVAKAIAEEADVRAVFGEPLKVGKQSVIPVARIRIHVGGGLGTGNLEVTAEPLGFIAERNGEATFVPLAAGDERRKKV